MAPYFSCIIFIDILWTLRIFSFILMSLIGSVHSCFFMEHFWVMLVFDFATQWPQCKHSEAQSLEDEISFTSPHIVTTTFREIWNLKNMYWIKVPWSQLSFKQFSSFLFPPLSLGISMGCEPIMQITVISGKERPSPSVHTCTHMHTKRAIYTTLDQSHRFLLNQRCSW